MASKLVPISVPFSPRTIAGMSDEASLLKI